MVIKKEKFNIPNVIPWLKFLFIFLPVCKPYTVQQIDILDDVFDIWGLLVFIFLLLLTRGKIKFGGIKKYIFLLCFLYIFFTFLNSSDVKFGAVSEVVRILILPIYFMGIHTQRQFISVCKKISAVYLLLIIIDCITIIWVSTGHLDFYNEAEISFLGSDNFAVFLLLPMFGTIHIIANYIDSRVNIFSLVLFGLCLVLKMYTFSLTAIFGMLVYATLIILWKKKKNCDYSLYLRTVTTVFWLSLFVTLFASYIGIATQALALFGKDTIFSRMNIWAHTIDSLPEHLIVGLGKYEGLDFKEYINLPHGYIADHVHNCYLASVLKWGIWGPIIFYKGYQHIISLKNKDEIYILLAYIISAMVIGTYEDYFMVPFFFILFFIYDEKRKYENNSAESI